MKDVARPDHARSYVGEEGEAGVVRIAGLPVARLSCRGLLDHVFRALTAGRGGWIVSANLDFAQRAQSSRAMSQLYSKGDLIVADGAPLVWAASLLRRPVPERVAGSQLVWLIAEAAAREGRSLYLLGGQSDSAERAARKLIEKYEGLRVVGWSSPWISDPPTSEELAPIREELIALAPDIVYVAFGSPKQEYVIDALRADLPGAWMMGCGISLSFIAGDVVRAPRWMQAVGLEWLHRLVQEPRRLAGRYLVRNLPFALRLLGEAWWRGVSQPRNVSSEWHQDDPPIPR